VENMAKNHSIPSAKSERGDFAEFADFMRRLVAVPHSEIKARLDAEKKTKEQRKRSSASRASRAKRLGSSKFTPIALFPVVVPEHLLVKVVSPLYYYPKFKEFYKPRAASSRSIN
jgi:hypothetical protein